jgi:dTDP-4-dehydrorhamnose reductase
MKIAVTGSKGKLGSILVEMGYEPLPCDILLRDNIRTWLEKVQPDLIINCASKSNPAWCEENYTEAVKVNVNGLANLHREFGERILQVSTDQVFNGKSSKNRENSKRDPVNDYGITKLAAETVSEVWGGKVIRLSRGIAVDSPDISQYLLQLYRKNDIEVPTFLHRKYLHIQQQVLGIAFFAEHFDSMPQVVNYGSSDTVSFYDLMLTIAHRLKLDSLKVTPRSRDTGKECPRPHHGGFDVSLASRLGFPMFHTADAVSKLVQEMNEE